MISSKDAGRKGLLVLVDPDKWSEESAQNLSDFPVPVDFFLVGGSLLTSNRMAETVEEVKNTTGKPVVLFPGSAMQVVAGADAILFLSLISGRNADLLIGQHVQAAPLVREARLEVVPTGYMLIESGKLTTAHYISGTLPIPADKPDIAACTAMAGEMLGLKALYMDAGSGAAKPISSETIKSVRASVDLPLIVGGGIRSAEDAERILEAGADYIVIGNAFENNSSDSLAAEIAEVFTKYSSNVTG